MFSMFCDFIWDDFVVLSFGDRIGEGTSYSFDFLSFTLLFVGLNEWSSGFLFHISFFSLTSVSSVNCYYLFTFQLCNLNAWDT